MGLLEFNFWLKKHLPKNLYSFFQGIYKKTLKEHQEKKYTIKRLKRNCDIWFLKDLLDKGTKFAHPYGIVITTGAKIGKNCIISQGVTIGGKGPKGKSPIIGDKVKIFANSVILGGIQIGDNSIIGAGSIVTKNIPSNQVWAGNPARFIRKIKDSDHPKNK